MRKKHAESADEQRGEVESTASSSTARIRAGEMKGRYLGPGRAAAGFLVIKNGRLVIAGPYNVPLKATATQISDIARVTIETAGDVKKSRAGKAVAFGVLALLAKSTQSSVLVTVSKRDGTEAYYEVLSKGIAFVRGRLTPMLKAEGIAVNDDATPAHSLSVADELAKLADLHATGVLTDVEFADQKAKLLSS